MLCRKCCCNVLRADDRTIGSRTKAAEQSKSQAELATCQEDGLYDGDKDGSRQSNPSHRFG